MPTRVLPVLSSLCDPLLTMRTMDLKKRKTEVIRNIIISCCSLGCKSNEIQALLRPLKVIGIRQVQKLMKSYACTARKSTLEEVKSAIAEELKGSGCLLGYRGMWYRLREKYKLSVSRDTVMVLLALMDEQGTRQRKSRRLNRRIYLNKGPNFLWHIDGYDKLKFYGIAIHGCIDGFSRKVLWLAAGTTNNDPRVIARYFVDCVHSLNGCPKMVRTDYGTENSLLAIIQQILRHNSSDRTSFLYGKSTHNQRIEALWYQLRKHCLDWWIFFLKSLVMNGYIYTHLSYHVDVLRFCFGKLIQQELDQFVREWNCHNIRPTKMVAAPAGKPNVLYHLPSLNGTCDYKQPINPIYLNAIEQEMNIPHSTDCSLFVPPMFSEIAYLILAYHNLPPTQPLSLDMAIKTLNVLLRYFN